METDVPQQQDCLFNRMYRHMLLNQRVFTHPDTPAIPDEQWQTLCWNAAWVARHFSEPDSALLMHVDDNERVIGMEATPESAN